MNKTTYGIDQDRAIGIALYVRNELRWHGTPGAIAEGPLAAQPVSRIAVLEAKLRADGHLYHANFLAGRLPCAQVPIWRLTSATA